MINRILVRIGTAAFVTCGAVGLPGIAASAQTNQPEPISVAPRDAGRLEPVRKDIESHMEDLEKMGFSGVLRIVFDGDVVVEQGYGFADKARKLPMKPEMVFDLSSITKNFTLAGIMVLVSEGKVNLTDKLGQFIGDVPMDKQAITVEYLMRHTSGLPQGFGADEDLVARDKVLAQALDCKLLSTPGAEFHYSDVGYALLAMIIENVSKLSYEAFLQQKVFGPASLVATGSILPDWSKTTLVEGWRDGEPWGTDRDYYDQEGPSWNIRGAGGIMSTAAELDKWYDAFLHYKIAPQPLVDLYVEAVGSRTETRNTRYLSTSGNNAIFSSFYACWMDENASLVLLTNSSEWPYDKVVDGLIERLNPLFTTVK